MVIDGPLSFWHVENDPRSQHKPSICTIWVCLARMAYLNLYISIELQKTLFGQLLNDWCAEVCLDIPI